MNEIKYLEDLINKFKLRKKTPLVNLWINFLLIEKKNITDLYKQANNVLNVIDNCDINKKLTVENIVTLYNVSNT